MLRSPVRGVSLAAGAVAAFAVAPVAQHVAPPDAPAPVVVRVAMTTKVGGNPEPRTDADGRRTGACTWTGRELEWRVDGKPFTALADVAAELRRRMQQAMPPRRSAWQRGPLPCLDCECDPAPDTRWGEVLQVREAALDAGFRSVTLRELPSIRITTLVVGDRAALGTAIVPPETSGSEPDLAPDEACTFEVRQDGTIVIRQRVLFRWRVGQEDDLRAMQAELRAQCAEMCASGRIGEDASNGAGAPVRMVADTWCEWRDVRRLLQCAVAADLAFRQVNVLVLEPERERAMRSMLRRRAH